MPFQTKRVYAPPEPEDGYRVLVDRLWPRGLSKDAAVVDLWLRDIAPSPELRRWFDHDPDRWAEFQSRYRKELRAPERAAALESLAESGRDRPVVTLLFGAREERFNHAVMLCAMLRGDDDPIAQEAGPSTGWDLRSSNSWNPSPSHADARGPPSPARGGGYQRMPVQNSPLPLREREGPAKREGEGS